MPEDPSTQTCQGHVHMSVQLAFYEGEPTSGHLHVSPTYEDLEMLMGRLADDPEVILVMGQEHDVYLN